MEAFGKTQTQTPMFPFWLGFISDNISFSHSSHSFHMTLFRKDSQSMLLHIVLMFYFQEQFNLIVEPRKEILGPFIFAIVVPYL